MTQGVNLPPGLRTQQIGGVESPTISTGGGKVETGGTGAIYDGYVQANNTLQFNSAGNPLTYSTTTTAKGGAEGSTAGADAGVDPNAGKQLIGAGQQQLKNLQGAQSRAHGKMESISGNINSNIGIINGHSSQMVASGKVLTACTQQTQKTMAWLETTEATMDQLQQEMTRLENDALGQIPAELGISAGSLDEAMEALSAMIDESKMEEVRQAQEEQEKIIDEMNQLDPSDADYEQKTQNLNGKLATVNTILNDPDVQKMRLASETLANLADFADSIAAIRDQMAAVSVQVDAKAEEIQKNADKIDETNDKVETSNKAVKNSTTIIEKKQTEADTTKNNFEEVFLGVRIAGISTSAVGDVFITVGEALQTNDKTAAVGTVLKSIGTGVKLIGSEMLSGADIAEGISTDDADLISQGITSAADAVGEAAGNYAEMGMSGDYAKAGAKFAQDRVDRLTAKAEKVAGGGTVEGWEIVNGQEKHIEGTGMIVNGRETGIIAGDLKKNDSKLYNKLQKAIGNNYKAQGNLANYNASGLTKDDAAKFKQGFTDGFKTMGEGISKGTKGIMRTWGADKTGKAREEENKKTDDKTQKT